MTRVLPLILLLTACGGKGGPLTFTTYNAGLAVGFVPGANERAEGVATAVAGLESDVVCLQEVWLPEHVQAFKDATGSAFPHSYYPEAAQDVLPEAACEDTELDDLASCMNDNCAESCIDEVPDCVLSNCALDFIGLGKDCMRCVQANIGGEVDDILNTCESETTEYAYNGSFGTGILSVHPLKSVEEKVFFSTTNRRSVLHAVVEAPGGDVDVYCTHLTAVFSVIPYPRENDGSNPGGWQPEQAQQITEMLSFVDETATNDKVVLLGDMNTGPATDTTIADVPENWALFAASRFTAPYVDQDGRCTFCADNAISSVDSDELGVLIDHVLVDGFEAATSVARVLDEALDIETCGAMVPGAHSDHYGVSVTVE